MREANWGWKKTRAIFAAVVISSACVGAASTAIAGTRGGESMEDMKAMIEQLKQTVQTLEQKMAVMEENQAETNKTVKEVAAKESQPSGLQLPANTTMKIYGYAKLDALYTDTDGGGKYAYTPSAVPLDKDQDKLADNSFIMHARQTRLGFATSTDTAYGKFNTKIETDFYGAGGNERISNSYGLRLRRAYGELGHLRVGQDWSTFIDLAAYPETLDFGGPAGSLFIRQALIRWTQPFEGGSAMFAIENPETTFLTKTDDGDVSINGGNNAFPDFIARVNLDPGFGHYSLAGMLRQLSIDSGIYDDSQLGYAFSANAIIPTIGKDNLHLEINYGNAMGRYMESAFDDAFLNPVTHDIETNDQYGGFVSYQHFWMENLRSTVIYSYVERDNDLAYVTDSADSKYQSAYANLIWSPIPRVNVGLEYIWAYREVENGDDGDMNRVMGSFQYKF
ncbi:MAG TPA: porin [Desulfobulbaceae bacterium]|nr:porin [Desulfobulbaceae bacterium]